MDAKRRVLRYIITKRSKLKDKERLLQAREKKLVTGKLPDGEAKEKEIGNLFEKIIKENFPNLVKEVDIQIQEAQRVLNKMDAKRSTPIHIIIKIPKVKDKERILKEAGEK